jgi:hypothetical protein
MQIDIEPVPPCRVLFRDGHPCEEVITERLRRADKAHFTMVPPSAWYSDAQLLHHPTGTITIYGRGRFSKDVAAEFTVENESDMQTGDSMNPLTEDEAFVLQHISRWGSEGYPIHKLQRVWVWGPIRGINGPPTVFKTKRAAVKSFERYLDILRDRLAGRI